VRSLLAQTYPADRFEIVVVVGASHDRTRDVVAALAAEHPHLRLVDNPAATTPTSLNVGFRSALGELIGRVDAHTWVESDFIATGVDALRRTGASGVGGKATFTGVGPFGQAAALALVSPAGGGNAAFRIGGVERDADTLAFGIYPREVFERVGPFDEDLLCNQDDEWHHRGRLQGERFVFTPGMRFTHVARGSVGALWDQYYRWGAFRTVTIAKHGRPGAARQLAPPALVAALAASLASQAASGRPHRLAQLVLTGYVAALAAAGVLEGVKARRVELAPRISLALGAMQIGYGLGFWREAADRLLGRPGIVRRSRP
jgi:GT2 family glycosyltransferase